MIHCEPFGWVMLGLPLRPSGRFVSQHPDFASVAARLQLEGQQVCGRVAAKSLEAAHNLKQIVDDLDFNVAAEKVKGSAGAAIWKVRLGVPTVPRWQ